LVNEKLKASDADVKSRVAEVEDLKEREKTLVENHSDEVEKVRNGFVLKNEELTTQLNLKDKQIMNAQNEKQKIQESLDNKYKSIEMLKKEINEDKNRLLKELDDNRKKAQEKEDELVAAKVEQEKETALIKQKTDFYEKQVKELQMSLGESQKR
jgi:chromosome segregation ATPase